MRPMGASNEDRPAEWKRYNDAVVTTVSRDVVLQQEALSKGYIFFYMHASAERPRPRTRTAP